MPAKNKSKLLEIENALDHFLPNTRSITSEKSDSPYL